MLLSVSFPRKQIQKANKPSIHKRLAAYRAMMPKEIEGQSKEPASGAESMKKQIGKPLMQKWKNKIGVRLSALDKKKLVLTNLPYALAAFYADRAFFLYRNSPGEDMGNKLLYAMEHADRIFAGFVLSNNWKDLLAGITVAVVF